MDTLKFKKIWQPLSIILFVGLISCRTYVPIETIKIEKEIVRDTVLLEKLVPYRDSVRVKDTFSRLENKYAYSTALFSGGFLTHVLTIKDTVIPVKTKYIEKIRIDTITKPVTVEKIVKVNYITKWQKFRLQALNWLVGVFVLFLLYKVAKFLKF